MLRHSYISSHTFGALGGLHAQAANFGRRALFSSRHYSPSATPRKISFVLYSLRIIRIFKQLLIETANHPLQTERFNDHTPYHRINDSTRKERGFPIYWSAQQAREHV